MIGRGRARVMATYGFNNVLKMTGGGLTFVGFDGIIHDDITLSERCYTRAPILAQENKGGFAMRKVLATVLSLLLVLSLCATSAFAASDVLNEAGTFPIVKEGSDVKLTIGTPAVATVTDYDDNNFTNYMREKMGCEIEIVLYDNAEYKTQLQLDTSAGTRLPDMLLNFGLSGTERESYGTQGYFIDLLPYFESGELTYWYTNEAVGYLTETEESVTISAGLSSDGALYGFPFWAVSVADPWSAGFIVNNTFCEALGMEIPETIDEFYEYLVAVKTKDPNGNGIADEIPLVGFANSGSNDIIVNLLNSFTYYPSTWSGVALCATDDGQIYVPYQTEEFKTGMAFIAKLYSEGLISDLSFSQDRYGLQAMTDLTGDALDVVGVACSHRSYMFADHNNAERRTHYTSIGPLEGPEGVAYAATYAVEPVYRQFITADCENPDVAFALLDFLTSTESTLTCRYGREGEYWRYCTEEEIAAGSSWTELGYTEALYLSSWPGSKLAWGQQTNEIWNITSITWQPQGFTALTPAKAKEDYASEISYYNNIDWNNAIMARYNQAPKNLVGTLAYTPDEIAMLGTAQTDIGSYVRECMTRMVTGEMNIESDWDTFQSNLEAMGLKTVLECAQAAWDRAH